MWMYTYLTTVPHLPSHLTSHLTSHLHPIYPLTNTPTFHPAYHHILATTHLMYHPVYTSTTTPTYHPTYHPTCQPVYI